MLVPGLLSDLEIFLDHKRYYLDNLIYIRIMDWGIDGVWDYASSNIEVLDRESEKLDGLLDFVFV